MAINDFSTLCRYLMRFNVVTREFTTFECVQQVSIITRATLTTFARGSLSTEAAISNGVCFITIRYRETLLGRGEGIHAWVCHAFLVFRAVLTTGLAPRLGREWDRTEIRSELSLSMRAIIQEVVCLFHLSSHNAMNKAQTCTLSTPRQTASRLLYLIN